MSKGLRAVLERRAHLVRRAAVERDELAAQLDRFSRPLAFVDRGLAFISQLKASAPLLGPSLALGFSALAIARPRSIVGWVQGAMAGWRTIQSAGRLVERLRRRRGRN